MIHFSKTVALTTVLACACIRPAEGSANGQLVVRLYLNQFAGYRVDKGGVRAESMTPFDDGYVLFSSKKTIPVITIKSEHPKMVITAFPGLIPDKEYVNGDKGSETEGPWHFGHAQFQERTFRIRDFEGKQKQRITVRYERPEGTEVAEPKVAEVAEPITEEETETAFVQLRELTIRTMTDNRYTLNGAKLGDLRLDSTIAELKAEIKCHEEIGIPIEHQDLIYGGQQLDNDRTLADYNISWGAEIHLVLILNREEDAVDYSNERPNSFTTETESTSAPTLKSDTESGTSSISLPTLNSLSLTSSTSSVETEADTQDSDSAGSDSVSYFGDIQKAPAASAGTPVETGNVTEVLRVPPLNPFEVIQKQLEQQRLQTEPCLQEPRERRTTESWLEWAPELPGRR